MRLPWRGGSSGGGASRIRFAGGRGLASGGGAVVKSGWPVMCVGVTGPFRPVLAPAGLKNSKPGLSFVFT